MGFSFYLFKLGLFISIDINVIIDINIIINRWQIIFQQAVYYIGLLRHRWQSHLKHRAACAGLDQVSGGDARNGSQARSTV